MHGSEVVIGGAGGAAAPPIIEIVRGLKGCQPPQNFWALRVQPLQYFDHNYLADSHYKTELKFEKETKGT